MRRAGSDQAPSLGAATAEYEVHASPAECEAWADRLRDHHDHIFADVRDAEVVLAVEDSYWSPAAVLRDTTFGQELASLDRREHDAPH